MKYSGHRKLLCELSDIYSCLQLSPRENWFQYVRREYATAINFPYIITLCMPIYLYIYISVCIFVYLYIFMSLYHKSLYLYVAITVSLYICMGSFSVFFMSKSIFLCLNIWICLYISMSKYLNMSLYFYVRLKNILSVCYERCIYCMLSMKNAFLTVIH